MVLTGEEDRNLLYVALSRGRYANHLYLAVASDGDPHNLIRPEALIPPTALDQLAEMLRRDGSPVSATTTLREQTDPHQLLGDLAARYHDAAHHRRRAPHRPRRHGQDRRPRRSPPAPGSPTRPRGPPCAPTSRSSRLDEHNPLTLLTHAVAVGSLADARDPAAVLDARIDDLTANRHRRPPSRPGHTTDDTHPRQPAAGAAALAARHPRTAGRRPRLGTVPRPPTTSSSVTRSPPSANRPRLDRRHRTRLGTALPRGRQTPTHCRPAGRPRRVARRQPRTARRPTCDPPANRTIGAPGAHQRKLNRAVREARPSYPFSQRSWYQALPETVRRDPWITPLCQRLARLERAGLPVSDYITQALKTDPQP